LDTYQGLIVPQLVTAYGIFLLRQFFRTLPGELEDAARIDGASTFGIFRLVVLPLSRPALATLAAIQFTTWWTAFLWPLIVTTGKLDTLTFECCLEYLSQRECDTVGTDHGWLDGRGRADSGRLPAGAAVFRRGHPTDRPRRPIVDIIDQL
jgi:ABC-type glycerol-3-phosphate transport system permease component